MSQRLWWVSTTAWQRARRISLENQAIQSSIDLLCILCYLLIESLGLGISEPAMPLPLESGGGWGIHEGRLWFYLVGPVLWHCWFASRKDVRLVRKRRLSLELSFWKLEQEKLSGKQITRINCIRCIWYVCVCVCARNSIMYEWYITVVYKCLHVLAPTYLADDCLTISAILLASDTYGPLAPGYCQYQEQGPRSGWGVSWSQVQSSGTVYRPPCELQLSPHWRSLDIWRPICSADRQRIWGPFMTRSTNLLIIIINWNKWL